MENLVIDRTFWDKRKVLVTGHTGFKGGWLSLWLQDLGAEVTGFALEPPTMPNLFERAEVHEQMDSRVGDIREFDPLLSVLLETKPDVIFHLAAQSLVRASYADPINTYATNVMGTVNLLEAVRRANAVGNCDVRAVLVITSDKCYENLELVRGYCENDAMGGADPYASSKGCAELVTSAFRRSFFSEDGSSVAIASARAGNVIGGGDWALDRLVPDAVRAFFGKETLRIRRPDAVRPWQHVLEPLMGYLLLCQKLHVDGSRYAEGWNFGPERESEQPVVRVVEILSRLWGGDVNWSIDKGQHPHEATYLKLDSSRAQNELGW